MREGPERRRSDISFSVVRDSKRAQKNERERARVDRERKRRRRSREWSVGRREISSVPDFLFFLSWNMSDSIPRARKRERNGMRRTRTVIAQVPPKFPVCESAEQGGCESKNGKAAGRVLPSEKSSLPSPVRGLRLVWWHVEGISGSYRFSNNSSVGGKTTMQYSCSSGD